MMRTCPFHKAKLYLDEMWTIVVSSFCLFSNTIVLSLLVVSDDDGAVALTVYCIARACSAVVNQFCMVPRNASAVIIARFHNASQFEHSFMVGVCTLILSLLLGLIPALPLFFLPGEQLTKTFISIEEVRDINQDEFYGRVKSTSILFIGFGFSSCVQFLVNMILLIYGAYSEVLRVVGFAFLLCSNAGMLGTYFGYDSDVEDLVLILLICSIVASLGLVLCWFKVSSFTLSCSSASGV